MKLSSRHLAQYIELPATHRELRLLLDDIGIEVKRMEDTESDTQFTLELLANRGDHHCYYGIGRELGGRTGGTLNAPEYVQLNTGESPVPIRCETPDCLVYTATLMVKTGESSPFSPEQNLPLQAAGIQSISPPVDATNLSNLELGQPTHAFDADTIVGGIVIRDSVEGERAWPLFTDGPIPLPVGTLVIADTEKILAIAGVIGCEESKTTEQTTRLLIESATFDPVRVRKASRALNIHTDSSARFERGADPTYPLIGAGRVVHLLTEHAGWTLQGASGLVGDWVNPHRQILLSIASAASFLEYPLMAEEVTERLSRYGFIVSKPYPDWTHEPRWDPDNELREHSRDRLKNAVIVEVPPHRLWDVEYAADLYEELAKSIGYNDTPERIPQVNMGAMPNASQILRQRVSDVFHGYGFFEVFTDGFYGRDVREKLNLEETHPLWKHVETTNALERGYSLLKNNNVAQALDAVSVNLNRKNTEIKAYEFTRTFHLDSSADNGVCREQKTVWAVSCGSDRLSGWSKTERNADVWFLKGIIGEMAIELGLPLTVAKPNQTFELYSLLHPNRQASILLGDKQVGIFGELHPQLVQNWRIKRARPCFLQLNLTPMIQAEKSPSPYVAPDSFHEIERNLAFTLRGQTEGGDVAQYLKSSGPDWLHRVDMVDLYVHEEEGIPLRTVTYALHFYSGNEKRTAEEVNTACEYLINAVHERFSDQGVRLRG